LFFTLRFIPETQVWLQRVTELGGWRCGRAEMAFNIFVEGGPFAASLWRREKGALWDLGPTPCRSSGRYWAKCTRW
jgi:hypothetical protein